MSRRSFFIPFIVLQERDVALINIANDIELQLHDASRDYDSYKD